MSEILEKREQALNKHAVNISLLTSDAIAISTWLNSYRNRSKETTRSFRKEAIRFLMWVELRKGQGDSLLRGVTAEDANEYLDFLIAPQIFPAWILQNMVIHVSHFMAKAWAESQFVKQL